MSSMFVRNGTKGLICTRIEKNQHNNWKWQMRETPTVKRPNENTEKISISEIDSKQHIHCMNTNKIQY